MSSKQLTASVRLNTSQAEQKLKNIAKAIDIINMAANKQSNAYVGVNAALSKSTKQTSAVVNQTKQWAYAQKQVGSGLKSNNSLLRNIGNKLKAISATYIGIMGAKAVARTSDTITSAQNRLNALNGATPESTNLAMNKMYVTAQNSRSSYSDMLNNVSKTMTLAGDAFDNNIDNAIRFQEIMAKAYTVGGASQEEASSSMYQLVQALGSGVLQGDELRSVREGAPIAYKEIEKFAQKVLDTEDSLKDLASQGVITSDMVVAAIMDAGNSIDDKFENTAMTFQQAANMIKNMAMQAFKPVLEMLNKALNSDAGKVILDGIGKAFIILANIVLWFGNIIGKVVNWCVENWEWLKYVVLGILIIIGTMMMITAAKAIWSALQTAWAWLQAYWPLLLIVAGIMMILYIYELWVQGTITTTEAIVYCLLVIAAVALIVGIILNAMWLLWVALAVAVIALIMAYFAEFCGFVNVGIQAIVNAWFWCGNLILGVWNWCCAALGNGIKWLGNVWFGCINWMGALFHNVVAGICNVAIGLWNSLGAIAKNIGIAFQNAWIGAQNFFWSFIQGCLEGLRWLEPAINAVAQALGADGFTLSGTIETVANKQQAYKDYVSVGDVWKSGMGTYDYQSLGDAWSSGMNTYKYDSLSDAWSKGWNTYDVFQDGWASDAYNSGYDWGKGIEDKINNWGSQFQDADKKSGIFSSLSDKLNLNNGLPSLTDPAYALDFSKPEDLLANIDQNTSDMKDSMDLSNDDMEYLRKIAEMEWRNEFTTAEIKVDMTNNNTVNSERDLDGIVEYLSDVLRAEMTNVAYGVHY